MFFFKPRNNKINKFGNIFTHIMLFSLCDFCRFVICVVVYVYAPTITFEGAFKLGSAGHQPGVKSKGVGRKRNVFLRLPSMRSDATFGQIYILQNTK